MLRRLPTFPPVSARLLQLVGDRDADLQKLAALIESDPAFSAEVLRLANSPLIGSRYEVNTVRRAVSMVGFETLCNLVWTSFVSGFISLVPPTECLRQCWRHSIATALICECLAPPAGVSGTYAYTAGLLHDVGRFALIAAYPREYSRMLEVSSTYGIDSRTFERDLFEVDHCQVGAWLVEHWSFPPEFRQITRDHHAVARPGEGGTLTLVRTACKMSALLGLDAAGAGSSLGTTPGDGKFPDWLRGILTPAVLEEVRTKANLLEIGFRQYALGPKGNAAVCPRAM